MPGPALHRLHRLHRSHRPPGVRHHRPVAGVALLWLAFALPALARGDPVAELRAAEIASCLPGERHTWGDGQDRAALASPLRLAYRHDGAPGVFSAAQVLQSVLRAAEVWGACGVPATVVADTGQPLPAGTVRVLWSDAHGAGHFGRAHLGSRTLALGRGAFDLLRQRNPGHPAHEVLQMVVSHELGHFYGLVAHSRRCVDVMSYYTDAQGQRCSTRDGGSHRRLAEYRALLPTACDIARCRAANAPPAATAAMAR
jgi:hypothetical protein